MIERVSGEKAEISERDEGHVAVADGRVEHDSHGLPGRAGSVEAVEAAILAEFWLAEPSYCQLGPAELAKPLFFSPRPLQQARPSQTQHFLLNYLTSGTTCHLFTIIKTGCSFQGVGLPSPIQQSLSQLPHPLLQVQLPVISPIPLLATHCSHPCISPHSSSLGDHADAGTQGHRSQAHIFRAEFGTKTLRIHLCMHGRRNLVQSTK